MNPPRSTTTGDKPVWHRAIRTALPLRSQAPAGSPTRASAQSRLAAHHDDAKAPARDTPDKYGEWPLTIDHDKYGCAPG
jgi:hypothetical protein